ncbi:MAG: tetratricopeptide repeat-containing glycosyltransferase [Sporichthyaceae bacterium]
MRVGLCMIVKDESHVLERCLTSVRGLIDHWTIVDTGSTDGTQDLIRELLADVPGVLLERPWRNFGHNRSEALAAAREHADYSFVIDADEVLAVPAGFRWPTLDADVVHLTHRTGDTTYWRGSLVANRLPWRYEGVLHEYLEADAPTTVHRLDGPVVHGLFDGGRSRNVTTAEKYARDARVLEQALLEEPDNARYRYYLARSYRDSGQHEQALAAYRRRAAMGGFAEEVYDSLYWIAKLMERAAEVLDVAAAYLKAWEARPSRAEPLVALARYARLQKRFALGRMVSAQALAIPRPDGDRLWVEEDVYTWRALDEFAIASYWTGHFEDSARASRDLLIGTALPASEQDRVQKNLDFALAKLPGGAASLPRQASHRRAASAAKRR